MFAGSLTERPGGGAGFIGDFGTDQVAFTFEVDAVYKGDLRDSTVEVWSASNGAACGLEMAVGEPVAIAASLSGGKLTGSLCSTFGVDQLEAAAADAGIKPTVPDPAPPSNVDTETDDVDASSSAGRMAAAAAGAALVVVLAAGAAVAVRRSRAG